MAVEKVRENNAWKRVGVAPSDLPQYEYKEININLWGQSSKAYLVRWGRMVTMRIFQDFSSARTNFNQDAVGVIPDGFKPTMNYRFTGFSFSNSNNWQTGTYYACMLELATNGNICFRGNNTEMKKSMGIQVTATYLCDL